jgi:hypothetical protein
MTAESIPSSDAQRTEFIAAADASRRQFIRRQLERSPEERLQVIVKLSRRLAATKSTAQRS